LKNPASPEGARRLAVLAEICALARDFDALAICGDLFDSAAEASSLETQLRQTFAPLAVPVLIIPGNHDFLRGDDPFSGRLDIGQSANVRILRKPPFETFQLGPALFYGFPFARSASSSELFRELGVASAPVKIALMHGVACDRAELAGWAYDPENAEEGGELLIRDRDLGAAGFSAALLGHIHRFAQWDADGCLASYCGSPDAVRITEDGPHTVNAVTAEEGNVSLARLPLKSARSARRERIFVFPGDESALADRLDSLARANPPDRLLGIVIEGIADAARVKEAAAAARARWSALPDGGPEISVKAEDTRSRAADMIMFSFLRRARENAAAAQTPAAQDMARRVAFLGWRALTGAGADPDELL